MIVYEADVSHSDAPTDRRTERKVFRICYFVIVKIHNSMKKLMLALHQKPVAYYPIYKDITGSTTAGILLSQLMYWWQKVEGREFYKTDAEIIEETHLSEQELKTAKKALKKCDFIHIKARGVPAKTYYNINTELLIQAIQKGDSAHSRKVKSTKLKRLNQPNKKDEFSLTEKVDLTIQDGVINTNSDGEFTQTITENTQKITTEITSNYLSIKENSKNENSENEPIKPKSEQKEKFRFDVQTSESELSAIDHSVYSDREAKKVQYLEDFKNDYYAVESLTRKTKMDVSQVLRAADEFATDQIAKEDFQYPTYKDFKTHFYNWLLCNNLRLIKNWNYERDQNKSGNKRVNVVPAGGENPAKELAEKLLARPDIFIKW